MLLNGILITNLPFALHIHKLYKREHLIRWGFSRGVNESAEMTHGKCEKIVIRLTGVSEEMLGMLTNYTAERYETR